MKCHYFIFYLFFSLTNIEFGLSQYAVNFTATPESHPGAMDGKIIATIADMARFPPPYIFKINEANQNPIEVRDTTGTFTFINLGYRYYCITVIMGDSCQTYGCFQFDKPYNDECFTADISPESYSICQREKIQVLKNQIAINCNNQNSINELIKIASTPLTNDSIKVEIIHFFRGFPCDTCIAFLVNHITDRFSYGSGASEMDQFNWNACFSTLANIAMDKNKRWNLIRPILNSLRRERKSNEFVRDLSQILQYISNKEVAKSILQFELDNATHTIRNFRNHVYEDNLRLMLKNYD